MESYVGHQTLIICESENVATFLREKEYDVGFISMDQVYDEREPYIHHFLDFKCSYTQALCISYGAWRHLKFEIEKYAMNNINVVLYDLDPPPLRACLDWLKDADMRGFKAQNITIC